MPRLPQVLNPDGAARAAGKGAMPRLPHVNPDAGAARAGGTRGAVPCLPQVTTVCTALGAVLSDRNNNCTKSGVCVELFNT